ncbi:MAG: hypothetical protein KAI86_05710 [Desulfobacterales bacterium]|nr:hypothetical protein [Desulfobacterales bacterium]
MKISSLKPVLVSLPSAILASLCCVLPLIVVLLGIGSGAFMMDTMKYSYIFIPIAVVGVGLGYFFYFQEKKKCNAVECRMAELDNSDIRHSRGPRGNSFQYISRTYRPTACRRPLVCTKAFERNKGRES